MITKRFLVFNDHDFYDAIRVLSEPVVCTYSFNDAENISRDMRKFIFSDNDEGIISYSQLSYIADMGLTVNDADVTIDCSFGIMTIDPVSHNTVGAQYMPYDVYCALFGEPVNDNIIARFTKGGSI